MVLNLKTAIAGSLQMLTRLMGQGTGLGLATVFGMVKQNQGAITVHSAPGHGATFTIHLPRLAGAAPEAVEPPSPTGSATVLLVEDAAAVLKRAHRALLGYGYRVLPAALAQCEQYPGTIHLILTDVELPDMNGKALATRILLVRPASRVLFMSGYSAESTEAQEHRLSGVEPAAKTLHGPRARAASARRPGCLKTAPRGEGAGPPL